MKLHRRMFDRSKVTTDDGICITEYSLICVNEQTSRLSFAVRFRTGAYAPWYCVETALGEPVWREEYSRGPVSARPQRETSHSSRRLPCGPRRRETAGRPLSRFVGAAMGNHQYVWLVWSSTSGTSTFCPVSSSDRFPWRSLGSHSRSACIGRACTITSPGAVRRRGRIVGCAVRAGDQSKAALGRMFDRMRIGQASPEYICAGHSPL